MRLLVAGLEADQVKPLVHTLKDVITELRVLPSCHQLVAAVERSRPDVVAIHLNGREGHRAMEDVLAANTHLPVLAVVEESNASFSGVAFSVGCADVVFRQEGAVDMRRALESLVERGKIGKGRVVSFIGGKGGVGTTAMAINFAAEMAERGQPVALVDLNLYVGDVAEAVGVVPEPSLNWFLKKVDRMDAESMLASAPKHPRGLQVFGLTEDLSSIDSLGADQISRFFSALRIAYKWIIVDCGSNFAEETLTGIANSDYRVMVTSSDRLSIAGTRRRVEALKNVVEDHQNTKLIINRMGDGRELDPSKVERAFGIGLLGTVRNAWTEVAGSMESRSLLLDHSPDAGVTQDIALIVDRITGGAMSPSASANRPPQLVKIAS